MIDLYLDAECLRGYSTHVRSLTWRDRSRPSVWCVSDIVCGRSVGGSCKRVNGIAHFPHLARPWVQGARQPRPPHTDFGLATSFLQNSSPLPSHLALLSTQSAQGRAWHNTGPRGARHTSALWILGAGIRIVCYSYVSGFNPRIERGKAYHASVVTVRDRMSLAHDSLRSTAPMEMRSCYGGYQWHVRSQSAFLRLTSYLVLRAKPGLRCSVGYGNCPRQDQWTKNSEDLDLRSQK